jgi:hypothetical protein
MIGSTPIARPFRTKDAAELVPYLVSDRATSVHGSDNMAFALRTSVSQKQSKMATPDVSSHRGLAQVICPGHSARTAGGTRNGDKVTKLQSWRMLIQTARRLRYNSLSSVIGSSRTRRPVALKTALATAAPTPVIPISPTPCAPIGVCGSAMSVQITSMSGTSR